MRIRNLEALTSHGNAEGRRTVARLLDAGLASLDIYSRVKSLVTLDGDKLLLRSAGFEMKGDPRSGDAVYSLSDYDRVYVVGAAKGVGQAALALEEILGGALTGGHVVDKYDEPVECKRIGVTLAGHPIPDENCAAGCERILELAESVDERCLVFTVFGSGCGSLLTCPAEGLSIADIARFTRMMQIEKGVPTSDLNVVRTHLDRLKGGRLARLLRPATVINLVTADPAKTDSPALRVSYFDMLKSNTFFPSVAAASTFSDAVTVIKKWDAWEETPEPIKLHLLAGAEGKLPENLSVAEYETFGARFFGLIFKDSTVYPAVRREAARLGLKCVMLSEYMRAEAREAGYVDSAMALCSERTGEPFPPPVILMSSGENVVTVGSERGVGGRNQEYCAAAAINIAGSRIVVGAVDTDGTDGPGGLRLEGAPGCLAGAVVDGFTLGAAREKGADLWQALRTHATSEPLWRLGCGVDAVSGISALDLRIIYIM